MERTMQTDLFGQVIPETSVRKTPDRKSKPATKLIFDRKSLWSSTSVMPGTMRVDEDELEEVLSTSDTRSDNVTIERLEQALGLAPVVKGGQWATDVLGYLYRRVGKPFKGSKQFGERHSLFRDLTKQLIITHARNAIEPLYTDPCCWLVINSITLLDVRLRMMDANEDPYSCLRAFYEVHSQHDFIDNTRKGDTIRSLTKRDQMRDKREAARQEKARKIAEKPVSKSLVRDLESGADAFDDEGDNFSDFEFN